MPDLFEEQRGVVDLEFLVGGRGELQLSGGYLRLWEHLELLAVGGELVLLEDFLQVRRVFDYLLRRKGGLERVRLN